MRSTAEADHEGPPALLRPFLGQFGNPSGGLGRVAGRVMARMNRGVIEWAVDRLDVGVAESVLEVGCGPGVGLELLARQAPEGQVVGVDQSPAMVAQAVRRNRAAVRRGHLDVRETDVVALPFPDRQFGRALTINSLHHWDSPRLGLVEIARVLAPEARLVIIERMRRTDVGRLDPARGGLDQDAVKALTVTIAEAGFESVTGDRAEITGQRIVALVASRRA